MPRSPGGRIRASLARLARAVDGHEALAPTRVSELALQIPLGLGVRGPTRLGCVSSRPANPEESEGTARGRRLRLPIQLVRLPRGRVRVMIARTSTGRTVVRTRRCRTCAR